MTGRQGGKLKPLKGPKKDNNKQLTEEDKVYQEKKKKELAELEEAKRRALLKRGPLVGGGIKKSGPSGKK